MNYNRTEICCCVHSSREGKRLTVEASGKEDVVHGGVPIISSVATSHIVGIDKDDAVYRLNENGEKTPLNKPAKEARGIIKRQGIITNNQKESNIRD